MYKCEFCGEFMDEAVFEYINTEEYDDGDIVEIGCQHCHKENPWRIFK